MMALSHGMISFMFSLVNCIGHCEFIVIFLVLDYRVMRSDRGFMCMVSNAALIDEPPLEKKMAKTLIF
jgi:hypothetical protein